LGTEYGSSDLWHAVLEAFFYRPDHFLGPVEASWLLVSIYCDWLQIRNMAEKVPSFKEGGALWFTDLTTADPYFILPVMSGLFTLATIEVILTDFRCQCLLPYLASTLCVTVCGN
jgi:hypothetical protein